MATRRAWTEVTKRLKPTAKPKSAEAPKTQSWRVVKGDKVQVMGDTADAGKRGTVVRVLRDTGKVLVEGVNMRRRFEPGSDDENKGRFFEYETPIHVAQVSLLDPKDGEPTKIKWQINEQGKRIRVSKRSDMEIPKPKWERLADDGKPFEREKYEEQPCDTQTAAFAAKTYYPSVRTFEEDVIAACDRATSSR